MIIQCKGSKKNSKFEKCPFLHNGNWGDEELIVHQKLHNDLESKNCFWMGFDSSQPFGKYTGRDGKRN